MVIAAASAVTLSLLGSGVAHAATASGLSATTVNGHAHRIDLAWSNPDGESVVVQMATDTYPVDGTDGQQVYAGTGSSVGLDDLLTYRTTYYFSLFTKVGATYTADGQAQATTPLPPIVKPLLSNASDWQRPKIRVSFSRSCTRAGCFRVNWTMGSEPFPATPFSESHQATLASTSPQTFAVGRDLTTYNVSLWQVGPGSTYGRPVHRRITLPEWMAGLRTGALEARVRSAHRVDVDWANPKYHSKALKQIRLYQSASRTAPGAPTRLPIGAPIWRCDWPCSRPTIHVTGLRTLHPYTYAMYGADSAGHVRRMVSNTEVPRVRGFYEGSELIDRQAETHSTVRDRRDRTHLVSGQASGALRYVVRASGSPTWVRHEVPGLSSASRHYDQAVLGLSQSGNRVYLATYCIGGTGHPANDIYLTSKPANGEFDSPVTVAGIGGYCGGGDYEGEPTATLGDVTADAENHAVLAYSTCDTEPAPGDNCSTDVVRQVPDQPLESAAVVAGSNWLPAGRPRIAVSDNDDYVLVQAGSLNGVFGTYAWTKNSGQSAWSAATQLAVNAVNVVDGVVAGDGQMWVLVTRRNAGANNGLYLFRRPIGGSWHGPNRLPHTDAHDIGISFPYQPPEASARLALNAGAGVLDVVYTRAFPKTQRGGLRHLRRDADGTWSQPKTLTSWWQDVPQDLMLTSTGAIRYSYLRY